MATPHLYFRPGGIAELVLQHCPELRMPFNPTIWAPEAHSQSAMGMLRTLTARGSYTRQLVMTSDHGTLGLDWWCGSDKATWAAPDAPIVLFIHGINGGSHEGYVKWACVAAASRGWRAVVLNMRGCNGLPLTSARGYNAINTADVHVAVQSIHSRFPEAALMAAGYSLGSVLLAKYVAEADNGLYGEQQMPPSSTSSGPSADSAGGSSAGSGGSECVPEPRTGSGLVAAALVSPPVCLHTTNSKMGQPYTFKFLYNLAVAYKLREYVKEHAATINATGMSVDIDAMLNTWTVSSFDDAVTLKALGYPAPHLYYRHACSTNYIPHIRTPTLILLSKDDPFLGVIPQEQVQHNPFTLMAATRRGGHLAFLQGWWPLGQSYCDTVIDGWLSAALQEWRHGSSINMQQPPQTAAGAAAGASVVAAAQQGPSGIVTHPPLSAAAQSTAAGVRGLRQQQQQRLPSWVQRAVAGGLLDPQQQFDPTTLASILCSCNPELKPVEHAHAVDAVLNTATAPVAPVAAAASKAAAAVAGPRQGQRVGSSSSNAKYSWLFGFGRSAPTAPTTPGSALPGLRGEGAWEPFGDEVDSPDQIITSSSMMPNVSSTASNADAASGTDEAKPAPSTAPVSRRGGWWGGWGNGHAAAAAATPAAGSASKLALGDTRSIAGGPSAQLRSKL